MHLYQKLQLFNELNANTPALDDSLHLAFYAHGKRHCIHLKVSGTLGCNTIIGCYNQL